MTLRHLRRKQAWRILQLQQNLGSQLPKLRSNRRSREEGNRALAYSNASCYAGTRCSDRNLDESAIKGLCRGTDQTCVCSCGGIKELFACKKIEELAVLESEIQSLQQSGDVREGTVLYKELSTLHAKVENSGLESQQVVKTVFDAVNEQLAKVKQETASTVNFVLIKLTEQPDEQKAMVEAVGKMVAELKLMQGKLDAVQNCQTENEQKYAEMHADYLNYKIKNEEIE